MNTSPNGDAPESSVNIPANIATLARQLGYTKADGSVNRKAIADAAGIPDSTFYRNLDRPEKFSVDHLGGIAATLGTTIGALFRAA